MKKQFISWRRVSTFRQSKSGLGLEAQKEIIRYFIERDKGDWVADYEECYTGTELSGCTELKKAMAHAKKIGAVLIIAKTDRFRNTAEALRIYEEMGDGNIMFCDLPSSDKFSLTLFFALAEREALIVSIRTKQALAVKKAHGCKLGGASETYRENYERKSEAKKASEAKQRGVTKNQRHKDSRDVQAFVRVLRNIYTDVAKAENPARWRWEKISLRGKYKCQVLAMMKDYKELDESGNLFASWDFSDEEKSVRKLRSYMQATEKSFKRAC